MRIITRVAVLASTVLAAAPALAQVQSPQDQITAAIARARQAGIPVALLESKIAEGQAKGVSMERIAAAIESREAALERANQALAGQQGVREHDLSVAADALESGVSDVVLRSIAETTPQDRRAVAIAALTQLVELGHVPEAALERVRDAVKRGPDALANLPAQAGAATGRRGGPPTTSPAGDGRAQGGPPASVPAPGDSTQSTKPTGRPTTPGKPTTGPASGRGGV
jgi:hypothetical protein